MASSYLRSLLTLLLLLSLSTLSAAEGKLLGGIASTHPDWFKESFLELSEDVAEAEEEGRHVMLFLHLNGCPYCYKMIEENIKNAPYTGFIREHFDVIGLNIRGDREVAMNEDVTLTEKALASRLKVVYTPTIIFLNGENQVVARINGYRSVPDFKRVLDYVQQQAYRDTKLADYLDTRKQPQYEFRAHPQLAVTRDLGEAGDKPLAVLFEDRGCTVCEALHDGHLASPEVRKLLENFHFVRLDALSDDSIKTADGRTSTPRAYAKQLGLTYRPGIVLFDQGKEIMRIESMLYRYHFSEILRYVGERLYLEYPESFYDYLDVRTAQLLESGQDVDLAR